MCEIYYKNLKDLIKKHIVTLRQLLIAFTVLCLSKFKLQNKKQSSCFWNNNNCKMTTKLFFHETLFRLLTFIFETKNELIVGAHLLCCKFFLIAHIFSFASYLRRASVIEVITLKYNNVTFNNCSCYS